MNDKRRTDEVRFRALVEFLSKIKKVNLKRGKCIYKVKQHEKQSDVMLHVNESKDATCHPSMSKRPFYPLFMA